MNRVFASRLLELFDDGGKYRLPTRKELEKGTELLLVHIPRNLQKQKALRALKLETKAVKIVLDSDNTWDFKNDKVGYHRIAATDPRHSKSCCVPSADILNDERVPDECGDNLTSVYVLLKDEFAPKKRPTRPVRRSNTRTVPV